MVGGQDFTPHQEKIVKRYYQNKDTISSHKLGELVSELYLCTDAKKADRLWQRVELALKGLPANAAQVRKCLADRDVKQLATILTQLG